MRRPTAAQPIETAPAPGNGSVVPFRANEVRPGDMRPTTGPLHDALLVSRANEGAGWARAALFRQHAPKVLGMLTRLLNSTADAEDATQDAFLAAFRDLSSLKRPAEFAGWVTRIAVHQAHRRFRRRRLLKTIGLHRHVDDATLEQLADERVAPESRAELSLLQKSLDRLPAAERTAWMLRHIEGYELTEVARLTSCSLATTKRRLAKAHLALEPSHPALMREASGAQS